MNRVFLILFIMVSGATALAFPEAPFDALQVKDVNVQALNQDYDFEGIVKLSNCSGSVVRFSGQPDSSRALVLTNGHCVKSWGFLNPGEVWLNKPVSRRMKVADRQMRFHEITATKILYATMTNTDAALYELEETYSDLQQYGISALMFSPERPMVGVGIEIVSGYWERGYNCKIDDFVYMLKEANWTFTDSIRYTSTGCEVIGGTSGSPIVELGTRVVVGVNNTGNQDGYQCRMNNPCEVDEDGQVSVLKGINYGQQTYNFYDCLTPDFKINPSLRSCSLPN